MRRPGFIVFTLRPGEALRAVPAHLDLLLGAALPVSRLDRGPIDRALRPGAGGFRAVAVFHARASLARPAEQHVGYDDLEEHLGMSRTYRVRLSDGAASDRIVDRLRTLGIVESAAVQQLASAPFGPVLAPPSPTAPGAHEPAGDTGPSPHDLVDAPQALAIEPGDERVTVACVDTGVSLGHPELQRRLLAGYDTVDLGLGAVGKGMRLVGDSRGEDFSPLDAVGHGTHVASIVGAQGWRMPRGVAGQARILPIRVLAAALAEGGRQPVGVGALPDIDAGIKVAVDLGADVLNMSFGTAADKLDPDAPTPHAATVAYAVARGCVLVAAAGNSGREERFWPAAHPDVIAVGSVGAGGHRSSFSTFGTHVDLAAPGERIFSADRHGYRAPSGTSFAAPFVAGAAGLLLAADLRARPATHEAAGPIRARAVRDALINSTTPLPGGAAELIGTGRLSISRALSTLHANQAVAT